MRTRLLLLFVPFLLFSRLSFGQAPAVDPTRFFLTQGPDWDSFVIYEKALPFEELQSACRAWSGRADTYYGCSRISFVLQTCHFLYAKGSTSARSHELLHCRGYDHTDGNGSESPLLYGFHLFQRHLDRHARLLVEASRASFEDAASVVLEKMRESSRAQFLKLQLPLDDPSSKGWIRLKP
jgi:hypothetical protein